MARKVEGNASTGHASGASRTSSGSLKTLRTKIDKLDSDILKLVNERAQVALEIGKQKGVEGENFFSPAREEEVLQNVLQANDKQKGPLQGNAIRAIFREIMSGTRALQKVMKVAYLGPEQSYSHLAAIERFGHSVEFVSVASISAVFEEVNRGHVDLGVVPVQNSTDGRVTDTLDMFLRMKHLVISGEIRLQVRHNLLANCDQQQIRRVYSKPQALSQCRNWLSKNVPHAQLVNVSSTAAAAELAQTEPGAAAVASRQAAATYGLRVLFPDIEDSVGNETRFVVIGHQKCDKTGNDKTTIIVRLQDTTGSLVSALSVFAQNKINLSWIESFPARTTSNKPESLFFLDFEGHIDEAKINRTLKALNEQCLEVNILGSYPAAHLSD